MNPRSALLLAALRRRRTARATELAADIGVSQPTLARLIASMGAAVVSVGHARRTRYASVRSVRGLASELPVFRVDEVGRPVKIASLRALEPEGSFLEPLDDIEWPLDDDMRDGLFPGLPYFITDSRPQGFLGRAFARQHALRLRVPEDPNLWSDDDILVASALAGDDLPGNLIVGEASLEAFQRQRAEAQTGASAGVGGYPQRAQAALAGEPPGSSAAGEFPKFTAALGENGGASHAIVKFSPFDDAAASRRWADLLIAEHHAGASLRAIDVPAARSDLLTAQGRWFLEVERFDRIGEHGRRGVVTLASVEPALVGSGETRWEKAAEALHVRGWLSAEDRRRIARLSLFGRLIGNSDMHAGNLAFLSAAGMLALAPAYDMLPMLFAPSRGGELVQREFTPPPPPPEYEQEWREALRAALNYWQMVSDDKRVSDSFRAICKETLARLGAFGARFE